MILKFNVNKKMNLTFLNNSFGDSMKKITKLSKVMFALLVLLALPLSDAMSQNFIMETGAATYNATCGGVIKMKNTAGSIVKNNSNPLGTNEVNAVKGVVDWAATTVLPAPQSVQGLWYERMVISGGADKDVATDVYIVGDACATPLTGYALLSTYPFYIVPGQVTETNTFAGTFNYVGTTQTIFPATGDDSYDNLNLEGPGTFTVADDLPTTVNGTLTLPTGNTLAVLGDLYTGDASDLAGATTVNNGGTINVGTGDLTFSGNVTVTDGTLNGGTGDIIINTNSTLALAASTGSVNLGPAEVMTITGAITNAGDGTNLDFDCASIINYNGVQAPQIVLPTIASNPYGILNLSAGEKRGGSGNGNNIEVCANFTLAGGNLDMNTNTGYLHMQSIAGTVTYGAGTGTEEVVGGFRRTTTGAVAATDYTFNNYKTTINFSNLPDAGTYYQLNVRPGVNPNQYVAATDVNRKITASYDVSAMEYTLKVGYLNSENPTYPTVPDGLGESDLKFFEANAANTASEKIAGIGYTRNTVDNLHSLSLGGLLDGSAAVEGTIEKILASTNDLVLRANNTMYSIVDGRWSNPNVWDEGRIPVATDNVEVRTMVYVGIDGAFAGTSGGADNTPTLNTRAEFDDYGTNAAANKITIGNYANATLILGNEDNGATYVHKTAFNGTAFINNNTNLAVAPTLFSIAKGTVAPTDVNGLWLTTFGTNIPVLGTKQLENKGAISNQGIIEIGD
jgi:hypothetical protein